MLQFKSLTYGRGQTTLIEDMTLSVPPKVRIGLIGANGCGKSSLFKLILGEIDWEQGEFIKAKNLRINHVAQEVPESALSAIDYVLAGFGQYQEVKQQLADISSLSPDQVTRLYETYEHIQGDKVPIEARKILIGLGFSASQIEAKVSDLSGGWRVRLQLARSLLNPCDLLLLDEPTNHLDLEAILWLEKWCNQFQGAMIIIAHDSCFLDNVVERILHMEQQRLYEYKGNYSTFVTTRAQKLALNQKSFEKQQKEKAHLESFINRFKAKASKAKQAQSRVKRLEKMQDIALMRASSPVHFEFEAIEAPTPIVRIQKGVLGYECPLLSNISLYLGPGDRVALLGKNGQGKSTLIKCLANELALLSGDRQLAAKLRIGYFAQHQMDALDMARSAFDLVFAQRPNWQEIEVRNYLGRFQFAGDKVFLKIEKLSGGEKARVALALMLLDKPQLLLLDEPTNHLDIEMREALAMSLQTFNGALVVVSHDRTFIEACCDTLILIDSGRVEVYNEGLEAYTQWVSVRENKTKAVSKKAKPDYKQQKFLTNQVQKFEQLVADIEQKLQHMDSLLEDPEVYQDSEKLNQQLAQREALKQKLVAAEQKWEQALETLEQMKDE